MAELAPCKHGRFPEAMGWDVIDAKDGGGLLRFWTLPVPCCTGHKELLWVQHAWFEGLDQEGQGDFVRTEWNGLPRT